MNHHIGYCLLEHTSGKFLSKFIILNNTQWIPQKRDSPADIFLRSARRLGKRTLEFLQSDSFRVNPRYLKNSSGIANILANYFNNSNMTLRPCGLESLHLKSSHTSEMKASYYFHLALPCASRVSNLFLCYQTWLYQCKFLYSNVAFLAYTPITTQNHLFLILVKPNYHIIILYCWLLGLKSDDMSMQGYGSIHIRTSCFPSCQWLIQHWWGLETF